MSNSDKIKGVKIEEIKNFLKPYFPLKKLGQHFLINEKILKKIADFGEIQKEDLILEIGCGFGNLTKELAKRAKKVIAIDKDWRMIELAKIFLKDFKNVEFFCEDARKISLSKLKINSQYKLFGNLPYYIASFIIRKFLEEEKKPEIIIFLIQKEVAERICAKEPKLNILALSVQFYGKVKIKGIVKKENFWPKPKVDGAILEIKPYKNGFEKNMDPKLFFKTLKAGFSFPRKKIINNLTLAFRENKMKIEEVLLKSEIDPNLRPENIPLKAWIKLTKNLFSF